ncbi:hypothetical protein [Mesorhizobium sp. NPDC059025]|uniref:hypothetical protein n=1 Tax=unclassified Mesorhizobium TaxID=325217 RepID=UPI00367D6CDB
MRTLVVGLVLMLAQMAMAEEQVQFPELDTRAYCTDLVSKMLDKAEQKIELDKCFVDEAALKDKVRRFWRFGNPASQIKVMQTHFKEKRHQTYMTLAGSVDQGVGLACLDGRLDCRYPADFFLQTGTIPQLDSESYCTAAFAEIADKVLGFGKITECMNREQQLKSLLEPFWRVVHPRVVEQCKDFVSNIKSHTYGALLMCAANYIGAPCVRGTIECIAKN